MPLVPADTSEAATKNTGKFMLDI
uniref:Uncharacterized protein n=1 Tax=Rhizophora mucronata TaxID=61149 RepID=A0A2P2PGJ9_RHIMU